MEIRPTGFRFAIALGQIAFNELKISGLFDATDLNLIIPACQEPAYCAYVRQDPGDALENGAWMTFLRYASKKKQVSHSSDTEFNC